MQFKLSGILRGMATKQGKALAEGGRDDPVEVIQIEVSVTHDLDGLNFFVGQMVNIEIKPFQMSLDEAMPESATLGRLQEVGR